MQFLVCVNNFYMSSLVYRMSMLLGEPSLVQRYTIQKNKNLENIFKAIQLNLNWKHCIIVCAHKIVLRYVEKLKAKTHHQI